MEPERRSEIARHAALVRWESTGNPLEDFWAKVDKRPETEGGCWLWTGARFMDGHGQFVIDGEKRGVHRIAHEEQNGPIPDGVRIRPTCGVLHCARPDHWRPGAKLTEDDVRAIRASSESGAVVGGRFGVSKAMVQRIRARRAWKHVT